MADPTPPRLSAASLRGFVAEALLKVGLPPKDAATCAELMVSADLHGADGHGIFRLPQYVRRIRGGAVNVKPKVRVAREAAGMALVDGDNGMGHVVMSFAAKTAIDKARTAGTAWVGVRNSNHAGPASLYAAMPLEHDMAGLYFAVGNANHMAPWGGIDLLLSTNPIAVAVPGNEGPIVLDMATSVAAYGKVKTAAQLGRTMPEGWMIDRQGRPLTDPKRAGEVDEFKRRVDKLAREIRSSRPMPGVARIWLPGEQSRAKFEERSRLGIPIPAPLRASLDKLAGELKIAALPS